MLDNIKLVSELTEVKFNPEFKAEIHLSIDLFFYNIGGVRVQPAALALPLQTSFPVYLFGLTDLYGGFLKSQFLNPAILPWNIRVLATGQSFLGIWNNTLVALPFPNIGLITKAGDLFIICFAALGGIWGVIRVRCEDIAYGTFLYSFVSDLIHINTIRYIVPQANINQFDNTLTFAYQSLFGKTFSDTLDPRLFITARDTQPNICDIPVGLPVDKRMMFNFQMNFDCPHIDMVLFVNKIEPLMHKKN